MGGQLHRREQPQVLHGLPRPPFYSRCSNHVGMLRRHRRGLQLVLQRPTGERQLL